MSIDLIKQNIRMELHIFELKSGSAKCELSDSYFIDDVEGVVYQSVKRKIKLLMQWSGSGMVC